MRGRSTLVLVAALVGLGLIATVDAIRDGASATDDSRPTLTESSADELEQAGVSGVLYLSTVSGNRCRVRSLQLPNLQDFASFMFESCRFDVGPDGSVVAGPRCPEEGITVRAVDGSSLDVAGCAPAWRPDGELTFMQNGDVVTQTRTLVRNVARFARGALGDQAPLTVDELAWITDRRLAVLIRGTTPFGNVIVFVDGGAAVGEPVFVARGATMQATQSREVLVVRFGVQAFDRRGRFISANRFSVQDVRAVAESPDGRWVALARPGNVCIYEQFEPPPREPFPVECIEADARDLDWR